MTIPASIAQTVDNKSWSALFSTDREVKNTQEGLAHDRTEWKIDIFPVQFDIVAFRHIVSISKKGIGCDEMIGRYRVCIHDPSSRNSRLLSSDSAHHWHGTKDSHWLYAEELQQIQDIAHVYASEYIQAATQPLSIHYLVSEAKVAC